MRMSMPMGSMDTLSTMRGVGAIGNVGNAIGVMVVMVGLCRVVCARIGVVGFCGVVCVRNCVFGSAKLQRRGSTNLRRYISRRWAALAASCVRLCVEQSKRLYLFLWVIFE